MSASMIKALWNKLSASGIALTNEELKALAQGEALSFELGHLARTISGIACLVSEDGQQKTGAGNFQHYSDVTDLLFAISNAVEVNAECVNIASFAAWQLGQNAAAEKASAA